MPAILQIIVRVLGKNPWDDADRAILGPFVCLFKGGKGSLRQVMAWPAGGMRGACLFTRRQVEIFFDFIENYSVQ
jgi:hypothetical protein